MKVELFCLGLFNARLRVTSDKAMPREEFLKLVGFSLASAIQCHQQLIGLGRWLEVIGSTEGIPDRFELTCNPKIPPRRCAVADRRVAAAL